MKLLTLVLFLCSAGFANASNDPCKSEAKEYQNNNAWFVKIDSTAKNSKEDILRVFELLTSPGFDLKGSMYSQGPGKLYMTNFKPNLGPDMVIPESDKEEVLDQIAAIPGVKLSCLIFYSK